MNAALQLISQPSGKAALTLENNISWNFQQFFFLDGHVLSSSIMVRPSGSISSESMWTSSTLRADLRIVILDEVSCCIATAVRTVAFASEPAQIAQKVSLRSFAPQKEKMGAEEKKGCELICGAPFYTQLSVMFIIWHFVFNLFVNPH